MNSSTSLGDFISALYDTIDRSSDVDSTVDGGATSAVVTACTLELLRRQRRGNVIAALFDVADVTLH
jgi:hypothetical protein